MFPSAFSIMSVGVSIAVLTLLLLLTLLARWSRLSGMLFGPAAAAAPRNQAITLQSIELVSRYFQFEPGKQQQQHAHQQQQHEQPSVVNKAAAIPDINFDLVMDDEHRTRMVSDGRKPSMCSVSESMSSWYHYLPSISSRRTSFDCLAIGLPVDGGGNGQVASQASSMDSVYSEKSDHYLERKLSEPRCN